MDEIRRAGLDLREAWRRGVFCPLGEGGIDVDAVLGRLRAAGYDAWVVVEQERLLEPGQPLDAAAAAQSHNREALRELGLRPATGYSRPMLDTLFSPLAIGPVTIRNRIVSTSHQTSLVHDHLPTDDMIAYHEARARGGAGLLCVEATAIHHTGLLTAHTLGGYLPEIVPAYRRLSEAVHAHGATLFVQLFHGGREVISSPPRPAAVAPSSIPSARFRTEPRALTRREIAEMIDGYRAAAAYAAQGGIDGVEVCAGFDYLPTQFLSPHMNHRTDEYGGSFENRVRFLREVCTAMREGIGAGGAVGCRLTDESGSWDGNGEDEIARRRPSWHDDGLIDYLSIALGASSTYRGSSYIVPPVPVEHNAVAGFARRMKAGVSVPVVATGRIVDPADADAMIARGDCDACGMTRALITDPSMPRRAAAGKPFTTCIGCNQGCIGHYHAGIPIACTINPWTGHEAPAAAPAAECAPGTVVIVGAGPAGAAAAAVALAQGHRVVVFDRAGGAGGQMRLALATPGHDEVARGMVRTAEGWLAGADLRLATEAGADDGAGGAPDRVIVAAGAAPYDPGLDGALQAWDVLGGAETGRRVVDQRLGRRLDRPRAGGAAGDRRAIGAPGHERRRLRRGGAPVPAQHVSGAAGRGRRRARPPPAADRVGRHDGDVPKRVLGPRRRAGWDRHAGAERGPARLRRRAVRAAPGRRPRRRPRRRRARAAVVRGGDPRGHRCRAGAAGRARGDRLTATAAQS